MSFLNFVPDCYQKSILDINYNKLQKEGIKCILFDLDNTLAIVDLDSVSEEIEKKLKKLKKEFCIIIVSNNFSKRIKKICNIIDIEFISFSMKPLSKGLSKAMKKSGYRKEQTCIIGDQLISDVLGGKRLGIKTILVDPLSKKDLKITKINRLLEFLIIKKLDSIGKLKRGIYYE